MKAILVIDMPNNCYECPVYDDGYDCCNVIKQEYFFNNKRIDDCPLKPMPRRMKVEDIKTPYLTKSGGLVSPREILRYGHSNGWNDCLERIIGDENND